MAGLFFRKEKGTLRMVTVSKAEQWVEAPRFHNSLIHRCPSSPSFTFGTREPTNGGDRSYPVPSLFLKGPKCPYWGAVEKRFRLKLYKEARRETG